MRAGSGTVHLNKHFLAPEANPSTKGLEAIPEVAKEAPVLVTRNNKNKSLSKQLYLIRVAHSTMRLVSIGALRNKKYTISKFLRYIHD